MKPFKKMCAIIYLLACIAVLGTYGLSLVGPATERMAELRELPAFRIALLVCMAIMAVQALYVLGLAIFERPEPESVHPGANPDIEVTRSALEAVARATAKAEDDVLIEDVRVRVTGRERDSVRIQIDAIALVNEGLELMAHRMQRHVEAACDRMLGCSGATVRVRFLPSKTVTVTREVSGE